MARSIECKCEIGRFTCGYCLRNAPPWIWTFTPSREAGWRDFRAYLIAHPYKEKEIENDR